MRAGVFFNCLNKNGCQGLAIRVSWFRHSDANTATTSKIVKLFKLYFFNFVHVRNHFLELPHGLFDPMDRCKNTHKK